MSSNQCSELFSIDIHHSYYASGICENIQYLISQPIQKLINQKVLYLHQTPQGFSLLISTDQEIKDFLTHLKSTYAITSFSFDVISTDPHFKAFTDYPISELGIFSFYTPTEGDVTILERKFISNSTYTKSFKITIDFDAIIRFRESGNSPNYNIKLEARKTKWNYYIINKSNKTFERLEIKGDSEISFGHPTEVTLQNGETAYKFSSGSILLSLKERSEYSFDLINVNNGINETIVRGLPMANPTISETYEEGDTIQAVSSIYIYI
ncbi:hypothetical protein [uncultured Dokdonia sp.]|uniref:hypothetical protein n=1 Tax=uncultured Dokdonia sp. TaxID=575653 RepID=UPI002630A7F9|nr:hypothetical protein [uncultured Dokdonia sp.]